jgi:sterol desaturase/sphingolipid hydroxylase (fatty acid hydroxylase superfamily)
MLLFLEKAAETFSHAFGFFWHYLLYMLAHPAINNPYYVVIVVCSVCFVLELMLPKKQGYEVLRRRGFWLDLVYVFFMDFVFWALGFYAITSVVEYIFLDSLHHLGFEHPQLFNISRLPVIVQFLILFVLVDFVQFVGHWLLHRVNFLWAFHKIHHAQEQLGFASTRHFHWVEFFVFKPLLYIPFGLIGFSVQNYISFELWVGYFLTFFSHCNVKVNFGRLNYILINPETHYWHHAKNIPGRYGVNYASILNIWDVIFGTFYLPENKKPELGVPDIKEIPATFMGQMLYPFKTLSRKNVQNVVPAAAKAGKR